MVNPVTWVSGDLPGKGIFTHTDKIIYRRESENFVWCLLERVLGRVSALPVWSSTQINRRTQVQVGDFPVVYCPHISLSSPRPSSTARSHGRRRRPIHCILFLDPLGTRYFHTLSSLSVSLTHTLSSIQGMGYSR